jgi:Mg2+ and Co2+ transporter CorA
MSLETAALSARINASIRRYTALGTMLLPMTLVSGILGMNVPMPHTPGSLASFFGVLGVLGGFALICLIVFRVRGMI